VTAKAAGWSGAVGARLDKRSRNSSVWSKRPPRVTLVLMVDAMGPEDGRRVPTIGGTRSRTGRQRLARVGGWGSRRRGRRATWSSGGGRSGGG
jgi:hypothetical protein